MDEEGADRGQTNSPPVVLSSIDFLFITALARGGVVRLSLCAALSCGVDFWGTPVVGAQKG